MNVMTGKEKAGAAEAKKEEQVKRGDRQTRYLAQSVILEEAGTSGLVRIALITISLVICAFIAWSAVTKVDEIAVTSGEVIPAGRVQTIQHQEGGTILEIPVVEGQLVEKGDLLIRLDPTLVNAELEQQKARLVTLQLQAERLRAIGEDREPDFSFAPLEFLNEIQDQQQIFDGQLDAAENRRQVLRDQIAQREAELATFKEQEETLLRNLTILEDELAMRGDLYTKGLTSKMVYLDVQREVNDAVGDLAALTSERKQTEEALEESRNRLAESDTDNREQALDQMGDLQAEISALRQALGRIRVRVRRHDVLSPERGIVKGLQTNTIGGVIPPGGVLMEIVPVGKELLVETRITTRDVGHVKVGDPVTVKVATYDFARYGGIKGELRDISATTFLDENGEPYYKGIIALDKTYVGNDPEQNLVTPGMTVQADIRTGEKTLFEYILKPIYASVNESFRER